MRLEASCEIFYISLQLNDSFRVFEHLVGVFSLSLSLSLSLSVASSFVKCSLCKAWIKHRRTSIMWQARDVRNDLPNWDKNLRRGYKNILRRTRENREDSNRWAGIVIKHSVVQNISKYSFLFFHFNAVASTSLRFLIAVKNESKKVTIEVN